MSLATAPDRLLPDNGVLLHIGPHKTGTTALQSALLTSRAALAESGVIVPEPNLLYRGATALTGWNRGGTESGVTPPIGDWDSLDEWVRQSTENRLALSSEWFDDCTTEMITKLRTSWGDRLRVMVSIRPLERILPSTWQQAVKSGARYDYESFLKPLLTGPHSAEGRRATRFWHRQDHAALTQRWADVVGIDNVVVVVADERQPTLLYRCAEALIGVAEGTIVPGSESNRSLTVPEIAAVRAMYQAILPTDTAHQKHKWLQRGAVQHLVETRVPSRDEPRLQMPGATVTRIRELNREIVDRLAATGVQVLGDLHSMVSNTPVADAPATAGPVVVDPEIAALLAAGLYRAAAYDVAKLESKLAPPEPKPPTVRRRLRTGTWFSRISGG